MIYYADSLEAYRSDKFTGFTPQPENGGVITGQNGYWGFYSAVPATGTAGGDGSAAGVGGVPGWVVPVGIVVVLLAAGAAVLGLRRRATAADRE